MQINDTFSGEKDEDRGAQTRLLWFICLLGWVTLLTLTAGSMYVAGFLPFGLAVQAALALWGPYALMTPVVFLIVRRFPLNQGRWRANIWVHLLSSILFVAACEAASTGLKNLLQPIVAAEMAGRATGDFGPLRKPEEIPPGLPKPSARMMIFKAQFNLPLYWVIVAFAHALQATNKLRERERQAAEMAAHLAKAQLAGLRTQLQPHFLFNTLNSISALIPHNAKTANEMVMDLSDLLRMSLRDPQQDEILLSEELKLLGHYVDIQRLRFGERLIFQLDVNDDTMSTPVPPLLLQPLVENAIRYGVEPSEQPEHITVRARLAETTMVLEVINTCQLPSEISASPPSTGLGLANTRARLAAIYGEAHSFEAGPLSNGGFRVQVKISKRERSLVSASITYEN